MMEQWVSEHVNGQKKRNKKGQYWIMGESNVHFILCPVCSFVPGVYLIIKRRSNTHYSNERVRGWCGGVAGVAAALSKDVAHTGGAPREQSLAFRI